MTVDEYSIKRMMYHTKTRPHHRRVGNKYEKARWLGVETTAVDFLRTQGRNDRFLLSPTSCPCWAPVSLCDTRCRHHTNLDVRRSPATISGTMLSHTEGATVVTVIPRGLCGERHVHCTQDPEDNVKQRWNHKKSNLRPDTY